MSSLVINQVDHFIFWVDRLPSRVNPYYDLETRIKGMVTKKLLSNQDKGDLKLAFNLSNRWTWSAGRMKTLLKTLPKGHLQELIYELLKTENEKEVPKNLQRVLALLNRASMLDLSDLKTSKNAANWFHSRGLIKNSALKNSLEKEGRAIFKESCIEAKYFFYHILDVLIGLLDLSELGGEKHSRYSEDRMSKYEAVSKLEYYGKLLGYPAIIFGCIYTYVKFKAAALALTILAIGLLVVTLVAYQRYWKPCPKEYSGLKNLMIEVLHSKDPVFVRKDILRKVERAFKEKKGVLLVGDPGAGKSWIPRSLAEQITEGKICSFIKDPQIFTCGATKLNSYGAPSFDSISECFKNYNEQVIFFFDEFHSFFKGAVGKKNSKEDDIKIFCEDFKYIIGATTTKEYKKFIKQQPAIIDRRFIVVQVGKLEDKKIKIMLSQYLQSKYPTLNLDVKAIDYIIEKAKTFNPNTSKIDAAQTLLNLAVKEMETIEFKTLELKIDNLEAEKKMLDQELLHAGVGEDEDLIKKLEAKRSDIDKFKIQLEKKNHQVEHMRKIEAYYLKLKEQAFRMADPKVKLIAKSSLEHQWIEHHTKIKVIGDFLEKERVRLSLPVRLDCKLINKIIKERKG